MADTSDDELLNIEDRFDNWRPKMATASDFQRLNNAITNNLTKFNSNTTDLEGLVRKLGTPEDSEQLRDRYLRLQNETRSLMEQTNRSLQQLSSLEVFSEEDKARKKRLVDSLPKQYVPIINRFQEVQRVGARKERESLDRARAATYRPHDMGDSHMMDQFPPSYNQSQQQVVLPMEQEADVEALRQRDDQLRQLETNIVQVNELFKDVATLVQEQGGIIDSIEQHVVDTESNVITGNRQLVKAVSYQSSARRKKIILVVILIIVLIIVGLVLFFTLRK